MLIVVLVLVLVVLDTGETVDNDMTGVVPAPVLPVSSNEGIVNRDTQTFAV